MYQSLGHLFLKWTYGPPFYVFATDHTATITSACMSLMCDLQHPCLATAIRGGSAILHEMRATLNTPDPSLNVQHILQQSSNHAHVDDA